MWVWGFCGQGQERSCHALHDPFFERTLRCICKTRCPKYFGRELSFNDGSGFVVRWRTVDMSAAAPILAQHVWCFLAYHCRAFLIDRTFFCRTLEHRCTRCCLESRICRHGRSSSSLQASVYIIYFFIAKTEKVWGVPLAGSDRRLLDGELIKSFALSGRWHIYLSNYRMSCPSLSAVDLTAGNWNHVQPRDCVCQVNCIFETFYRPFAEPYYHARSPILSFSRGGFWSWTSSCQKAKIYAAQTTIISHTVTGHNLSRPYAHSSQALRCASKQLLPFLESLARHI